MKIPVEWNEISYRQFLKDLILLQDETYKKFNFKLIFTHYKKIGIRMPLLKELAKKIEKEDLVSFLEIVGDTYYEEILLEGLVIARIKNVEQSLFYFERYIEKIDNWALCDYVVSDMKIVKENRELYFKRIKKYVKSDDEYRVRVGLVLLLDYYIEKQYLDRIFKFCNSIKLDSYYVNMAIAWLISECFVKEKERTIAFLEHNKLNKFTQNKAISKIRDSTRVRASDKFLVLQYKK